MSTSRRSGRIHLGLIAALVTGTIVAATPAAADHEDPATSVTLVGSLQSELGCPADWAPPCPATAMGDDDNDGVWSISADVPAGSWEWKVALDGTWDQSYPDGNELLVLEGPERLTFSYDDASHRVAVAPADPPDGVTDADAELAGTSLRDDLTRERFYFVMADRFENGDSTNDTGGIPGDYLDNGFDPERKGFYHGGDIAGLRSQLDYIEGLGTTAIWLTPAFKNRPVQGEDPFISAGYHGYWITDFTQIDPHLGTNEELAALIDEAHARGIKVFFDIITNHTADVLAYEGGEYDYIDKATQPYVRSDTLETFDDRDYAGTGSFPPLDPAVSFPYIPAFPNVDDETVKVPAWLNDPIYYHNRGNTTFVGEDSEYGDFFGLDDLFTEHPDVVEGMTEIYQTWVGFGIDGFRIDTVKHVNVEFWQAFADGIAAQAEAVGNDDFFAFGEVFDASPAFMSRYTTEAGLQATLDFGFQSAASGFAQGRPTVGLRDLFAGDDYYTDTDSNAYSLPTFLGNHDMGRIGAFIAANGGTDDQVLSRDKLAHTLMYLSRGQPVVYYGDEQGFTGYNDDSGPGDQSARQDMFPSQVATYNDDDLIGTDATTAEANFDTTHPLYEHLAELSALRAEHPALADGAQIHRYASGNAGIYAFSRIDASDQREYVVALNNSESPQTVSLRTFTERGKFRHLWPAARADVRSDDEGRITVTVPALSAVVLRATAGLRPREDAPAMNFRTPGPGGTVGGRAEVGVAVPADGFNQVTLGWRPAGTEEWTALGTDDNAPYRVFHDVTNLTKGTLVEYRAVLRDHSGNLSVAQTYATVGDPAPSGGGGGGGGGGPVTQPDAVSVPGSTNFEMGCPGDWQPECEQAQLTLDLDDQIWKGTFDLPAANYAFKAAIDRSWDENYGVGGVPGGADIPFAHPGGPVTFYYDHGTHWVTNDVNSEIVTAAGSAQSELGCPADWSPDCMRPWLQDPDGDGTLTWSTTEIPAGSYQVKAAHGLSWDENYGAGGVPNGANIDYTVPSDGVNVTFSYVLATHILTVTTSQAGPRPDLDVPRAHWLTRDLLAWDLPAEASGWSFRLHAAPNGGLEVDEEAIVGGVSYPLTLDPAGLPADAREQWPHLAAYDGLRLPSLSSRKLAELLTGQLAVAAYDDLGRLVDATGVQIPGVLDDVYANAYDRKLGVTWVGPRPRIALWAPTAKAVDLLVRRPGQTADTRVEMRRDSDGVWMVSGAANWNGASYLFDVDVYVPAEGEVVTNTVTDPYALALTTDSARGVIVDLDDPSLVPAGWDGLAKPELAQPEDSTIYELHVRDFSIGDESVPAQHRGGYLSFTDTDSAGMEHLQTLADAGLNTVHLLPVFDIATIPERRADQSVPDCDLESYGPAAEEQQACVSEVAGDDGFNWGYDPWHYTAPEGSYATDPEGPSRTLEFRQMVAGLNGVGLRVVMDVVYNHTTKSGQDPKSVLDRIVPGYYHRLSSTGAVETSTCCANTASEHRMMEKLMVDSVVTWAREYKVDGFRFDLMGHHSLANMLAVRAALDELTMRRDGVDGTSIYLYGEGWDFGEVAGGARFTQARQLELAGTGIGSFTDRLRDAVRGGGPFDADPRIQGFATGLYTDPNGADVNGTPEQQLARLLLAHDQIKVGLAGNLADYELVDQTGVVVTGAEVDYNGQPAGYAADPSETITYVDAHDNETLFDTLQYKLPQETEMDDRVRMNTVALATTALSQGPSFWHAGADLLRSKSLDRNSYDSGDWFNRIDWTATESTWGSGLPLRTDNEAKWPFMTPLLSDPDLGPTPDDLDAATTAAADLLDIRFSSPLFRLGSADLIQDRVGFPIGGPDQTPGVITMTLDDTAGTDLDPEWEGIVVVFNATPTTQVQTVASLAGETYGLHPVQAGGADATVKSAAYDPATGAFSVPARTVAVFTTG